MSLLLTTWGNLRISFLITALEWRRQAAPLFFSCRGLLLPCTITAASIGQILTCTNGSLRVYLECGQSHRSCPCFTSVCMCVFNTVSLWEKNWRAWPLLPIASVQATYLKESRKIAMTHRLNWSTFFLVTSIQPLMHRQPCFAIKKGYMRCFKDNCSFFTHLLSMPCLL